MAKGANMTITRSTGAWITALTLAACTASQPTTGDPSAGATERRIDRTGDGVSVTELRGAAVLGVVTWQPHGDAVAIRAQPAGGAACALAIDRRAGTMTGGPACSGAVALITDVFADPAVRDEIAPAPAPLSAAPIESEDADRCGKGTNTVCSACVGSGFTDIWNCGACAWCLGF
jgi:hypothetical protein